MCISIYTQTIVGRDKMAFGGRVEESSTRSVHHREGPPRNLQ